MAERLQDDAKKCGQSLPLFQGIKTLDEREMHAQRRGLYWRDWRDFRDFVCYRGDKVPTLTYSGRNSAHNSIEVQAYNSSEALESSLRLLVAALPLPFAAVVAAPVAPALPVVRLVFLQ